MPAAAVEDEDVPTITIPRLPGWLTFYDIRQVLPPLTKQGVHRLVFNSEHFNVAKDVVAIQISAAQFIYLVRDEAVQAERQRRIDKGILPPDESPVGGTGE